MARRLTTTPAHWELPFVRLQVQFFDVRTAVGEFDMLPWKLDVRFGSVQVINGMSIWPSTCLPLETDRERVS